MRKGFCEVECASLFKEVNINTIKDAIYSVVSFDEVRGTAGNRIALRDVVSIEQQTRTGNPICDSRIRKIR